MNTSNLDFEELVKVSCERDKCIQALVDVGFREDEISFEYPWCVVDYEPLNHRRMHDSWDDDSWHLAIETLRKINLYIGAASGKCLCVDTHALFTKKERTLRK